VFIGIVLVLAGVLFVSVILRGSLATRAEPTARPPITVPVVVTTRSIPLRALLNTQDVTLVDVPVELVPLNAVSEIAAVVGKITKIPLVAGEMMMRHHLADPTNITARDIAFAIGDDQVVMAFPTTDLMSQVEILQPGDLVDILVSVRVPVIASNQTNDPEAVAEDTLFTFDALQRVEISAIVVEIVRQQQARASTTTAGAQPTPTPTPSPSEIRTQAILLALAPQDALVLKHLQDAGGVIDIVLRSPTSAQVFELNPVTSEYLKDRYELVIER